MNNKTPKLIEEEYNNKMNEIFKEADASYEKERKEKKLNSKKKSFLKDKFKEISEINTDEAFEISFKIDSNLRMKLTTVILLVVLIVGSLWIKYTSGDVNEGNHETAEEVNSFIHMRNVLKFPSFNDIINNKDIFEEQIIFSEAVVLGQEKESDNCLKLEVSLSKTEDEKVYLYYFIENKDLILKNETISFIGKITDINSNKKYVEIDAIRIDTGNGLFTEKDFQKLATLYTSNESVKLEETTRTINVEKYGSGYKNYCFDITKQNTSNFPNEFRIIDAALQSDIIDSTSVQGNVYSRIDINDTKDLYIKMKKDFKNGTFTLEFYDLSYNKTFEKSWKNVHTSDKFAYDYVSSQGKFYINIENMIYVFDEETGEEVKIDVPGKGYIDVDYKGNIYFISTEDDGIVSAYTNKGEQLWKEQLIAIRDSENYIVQAVNDIVVIDNSKLLVSFEVSEVLEDRVVKPTNEFALLKSKFGNRVNDTIGD